MTTAELSTFATEIRAECAADLAFCGDQSRRSAQLPRRVRGAQFGIVLVLILALCGCGDDMDSTSAPTRTPTPVATSPTPLDTPTPLTPAPTCVPTPGIPSYCATHCEPCPTIRAGCYAVSCRDCIENPVCAPNEICVPGNLANPGCCSCATPTALIPPFSTATATAIKTVTRTEALTLPATPVPTETPTCVPRATRIPDSPCRGQAVCLGPCVQSGVRGICRRRDSAPACYCELEGPVSTSTPENVCPESTGTPSSN